jgi:hypothetical protein
MVVSAIFRQFGCCFGKCQIHLDSAKQNRTTHQKLAFLSAFLKLVQINKVCSDNVRKLSICKRSK